MHERNSLQILTNSCVKSNCTLEFELKVKSSNQGKSSKIVLTGDSIQSETDDESNNPDDDNNKKKTQVKEEIRI